ncbi:MAG TPA: DoxX family protein [Steroidobacteraceae bacterium]|nr:DoxX family protein [Steroidobacteraceae bacterium]
MSLAARILAPNHAVGRAFDLAQPLFALALRWYVSWQFLKSGLLKVQSWDQTLWLFENEYRTPLLPPTAAAVLGVFGELVFPILLIVGFASRLSAAGLFAVNAVAVISYSHVLLEPGMEAALAQHVLWGFMILTVMVYGPGKLSLDRKGDIHIFAGKSAATEAR